MDDGKHLRWLEYADEKQRENNFKGFIFDDDKDKFVWFLNNPKMRCFTLLYWDILELISLVGAVNCATALLRGEVPQEVDINEPSELGYYPIHHAAKRLDPPLVLLFLRHGARTDIKLNFPYHDPDNGLLPLNIAINAVMSNHTRLQDWTPRRSIFDLIAILCHPELKDALETVRLLARRTKELPKIAYHSYAKEGKPIELAILLMHAHSEAFRFIKFQSKDGSPSDGNVAFSECINYEITSLMNEFKSTGATTPSQMLKDKMVAMRSMQLLLEVFSVAADIIMEYKQSHQPDVLKDQMVKDVISRLELFGIDLKLSDFDLSDIHWDPPKHALEESEESESYPMRSFHMPFSQQKNTFFNPMHLRWLEYADEKQQEDNFMTFIFDDDKDKFVWFLNNPKMRCFRLLHWDTLELISLVGAVNCATALLRGEVPQEVDINEPFELGYYPIHHAAERLDPPLVLLFLRHGARTDIKLNVPHPYHDSNNGLLPLNIAIKVASNHKRLQDWTPRRSIFDLIAILCHPELKDALETVRLLARRTKELPKIAYHSYAKEGKPIELAILFMHAVFRCIKFQSKDGSPSDGNVAFSECINYEITSLMNEFKSTGATTSSQMLKDKMVAMRSMLLMLEVFDMADDIIIKYEQSHQPDVLKDQMVKDVISRLELFGIDLKLTDFDLSDIHWDPPKHALEESEESESYPLRSFHMPFSQQKNTFFNPMKGKHGSCFLCSFSPQHGIYGLPSVRLPIHTNGVPKCIYGGLYSYSKTVDVQVKKRSKAMEQYVPKFMTSKKLAYFALVIRKGIRCA